MGCPMHETFVKTEEYRLAWLTEIEFAEKAHVLKMLARDLGQDDAATIDALARRGLEAALGVLAGEAGADLTDAYLHRRALCRANGLTKA